jgi:hypothetical protein
MPQIKNVERDYTPRRERNVEERMDQGASLKEGLSGRTEVTKRKPFYREYPGQEDQMGPMIDIF